jgi:hypothetical protein
MRKKSLTLLQQGHNSFFLGHPYGRTILKLILEKEDIGGGGGGEGLFVLG